MLGPYDQDPMVYDKKYRNSFLEWEYPRHARISLPLSLGNEHQEQLILDSEVDRRTRDLPQGPSWTARFTLNFGAWLVKAGCRLERLGFGRLGSLPAGSSVSMDCGCAS